MATIFVVGTLTLGGAAALSVSSTTRTIAYNGATFSASVVPASKPNLPPLVLLPPIGVGIDRTFCGRFVSAWAEAAPGPALHSIDVVGMGDSQPKPRMKRPFGGWDQPPRTPAEWAEQTLAYVAGEVGEPCVIVGQSNLCTVALEVAAKAPEQVAAIVLIGPPAIEALSIDKPQEAIDKVWRLVGTPVGAALFRFARRKAFLGSFSRKNLFADPSQVDDAYLDVCAAGAADASSRHAVFSFVAGTWRQDYRPLLSRLALPTLIVSGRDVGAAGAGVGKAPPAKVDRTSYKGLLSWFTVWRKGGDGGRFDQVARDLGTDPAVKLREFAGAMPAARAADAVESALLPGWNVLVYESPRELAAEIGAFVGRRFGAPPAGAQAWTEQAVEAVEAAKKAKGWAREAREVREVPSLTGAVRSWYDAGVRLRR